MPQAPVVTSRESGAAATNGRGAALRRRALLLVALVALAAAARTLGGRIPELVAFVDGLGFWGPAVFVAAYAIGVVLFVPGSAMTLAAGALFGVARGLAVAWSAATLGAGLAFLVARHLARDVIARRIEVDARFAAVDRAIGLEGRKIVFLLRLSPIFPFNLLNYALGLTRVRFGDYLLASVGMIPGTLLYVYTGSVLGLAAQAAGGAPAASGAGGVAVLAVGLAATLAVTIFVTRLARRALAEVMRD